MPVDGSRDEELRSVRVPTLVETEGMGHDYPPAVWETWVSTWAEFAAAGEGGIEGAQPHQSSQGVVAGFDPRLVTATAAGQVLAAADRLEKMAACLKSLAAARVAEADARSRGRRDRQGPAPQRSDTAA